MSKRLVHAVAALAVIGLAGYLYATRPVSGPSAPPSPEAAPTSEAAAEGTRYRIVSEQSKASLTIDEVLRGEPFTVVGVTQDVSGEFVLAPDARQSAVGAVRVNARTLATDSNGRNNALKRFILKTEDPANEFIEFRTIAFSGLPAKLVPDQPAKATLEGELTVAGTTRPVTFEADVTIMSDGRLTAKATATVNYKDFGLVIPNVPFVASVDEDVLLTLEMTAARVE
jgi:polyisoprenoid-binding protein YceI